MFHQVELGSADPVQLNGRGYTVDDSDWSSRAQPVGKLHGDVTVTCTHANAYETVQHRLAVVCSNLSFPEVVTQFSHQQLHDKVLKIPILYSNRYSLIILRLLSRLYVYHIRHSNGASAL